MAYRRFIGLSIGGPALHFFELSSGGASQKPRPLLNEHSEPEFNKKIAGPPSLKKFHSSFDSARRMIGPSLLNSSNVLVNSLD